MQRDVDFVKEVVPILQTSCVTCHSSGKTEADLSIETKEKLLEGGASAPAIVEGNSAESLMVQLVAGQDPDRFMPKKGKKLTPEEIGIIRAWIDQGAKWPQGYILTDPAKPVPAKLEPRNVPVPAPHDGLTNPIDLLLVPYFAEHKITPGAVVDDRTFARRVYLDIIGLLPPPAELEVFVADPMPDKRTALVKKLLSDNHAYAGAWLGFWNDLLRNDYKGTGFVDGGRKQITPWLYQSLVHNTPYDQFLRELVTGANGSDGFIKGIVWRGVVNAATTPQMQAAQNISQVFMGVNLKCASCHDSFINQWKLSDAYGLAGVYADGPLEMERCTKPLGKSAAIAFIYPELGSIDQSLPKDKRIAELAKIITHKENGRLTRTMVNRLWARLMGRGLIEPVDEMDHKPWNADVLDALAWDLAQHYDLKKTIETIVLSRAYQLPSMPEAEGAKEYVFAGPAVRRMSAEQFVDAISTVTGVWPTKKDAKLTAAYERFARSKWIWSEKGAEKSAKPGTIYLRYAFDMRSDVVKAPAVAVCDNSFELWVNGTSVAKGDAYASPVQVDLKPHLKIGQNILAIEATNGTDKPNPAGFWLNLESRYVKPVPAEKGAKNQSPVEVLQVATNATKWKVATTKPADEAWKKLDFDDGKWQPAVVVGDINADPWKLVTYLPDEDAAGMSDQVRTSMLYADPLTTALGRPGREQVNTVRQANATTLQMLELTNGPTLAELLSQGAKQIAGVKDVRPDDVVNALFADALGRKPTGDELATSKEIIGANVNEDGVEDLLWSVMMLPEFQLIR